MPQLNVMLTDDEREILDALAKHWGNQSSAIKYGMRLAYDEMRKFQLAGENEMEEITITIEEDGRGSVNWYGTTEEFNSMGRDAVKVINNGPGRLNPGTYTINAEHAMRFSITGGRRRLNYD